MIKLENLQGHNDMCGGYSYSGKASFEGKTVAEVLSEIKEFAKNRDAKYIGDGFGNPEQDFCNCWGIRINDIPYVGGWIGWKNEYHGEYDEERVTEVRISGGWYCFYDFYILCEETEKSTRRKLEIKMLNDAAAAKEEAKALKLFKIK